MPEGGGFLLYIMTTKTTITLPTTVPDVHRKFVLTALETNNNKVWSIQAWKQPSGVYLAVAAYGRVGDTLQQHAYPDVTDTWIENKIREKQRKGYQEVDLAQQPVATSTSDAHLAPEVRDMVQWLFREAGGSIDTFFAGRVDALSGQQIAEGRRKLAVIASRWSTYQASPSVANQQAVTYAFQDFCVTIPQQLPRRIDPQVVTADFCRDLTQQEDRLDQLEAALATLPTVAGAGASQYDALGATIHVVDSATPQHAQIKAFVEKVGNQGIRGRMRDLFAINVPVASAAFAATSRGKSQILTLCHGSRSANWRHIMRTGLRAPSVMSNGWMWGPGVYFASQSTKSFQYCGSGYRTGLHGQQQFGLLLCNVAVGRQLSPRMSDSSLSLGRVTQGGYDSVWAKAGYSSVVNDEYIVYDAAQHEPTYFATWEVC